MSQAQKSICTIVAQAICDMRAYHITQQTYVLQSNALQSDNVHDFRSAMLRLKLGYALRLGIQVYAIVLQRMHKGCVSHPWTGMLHTNPYAVLCLKQGIWMSNSSMHSISYP